MKASEIEEKHQHKKKKFFKLFFNYLGHFRPAGFCSGYPIRIRFRFHEPIESGSNPDPKHCQQQVLRDTLDFLPLDYDL
jgi:hypothetical protein